MIIDCSGSLPTPEFLLADLRAMCGTGYLPLFGPGVARWVGLDADQAARLMATDPDGFVVRCALAAHANGRDTVASYLAAMDEAGITAAVLHNFDEPGDPGGPAPVPNERVAELVAQHPGRLIGFAGISPLHGADAAVRAIDHAVLSLGLKGVGLRPFRLGLRADDSAYGPIYRRCAELGVPVWIHSSIHYDRRISLDFGRPIHLDAVAAAHPTLTIIAGHGGWPWADEMVAVALRQPNVVIDVSSVRPLHMPKPGSGWERVLHFGNNLLQDQVVIGLDWLTVGYPPRQLLEEIRALPLRPAVLDKWLGGNAARLFQLR